MFIIFIIIAFTRPSPRCCLETKGMGSGVIWPRLVAVSGGMTKKKTAFTVPLYYSKAMFNRCLYCHFTLSQVPYILLTHIFEAEDPPLALKDIFMQL